MKKLLSLLFIFAFVILGSACSLTLEKVSKDLSTYSLDIEYLNASHTLNVTQNLNLKNPTNTSLNELYFHLYPAAFSEGAVNKPVGVLSKVKAYPNGESYGKIEIRSFKT